MLADENRKICSEKVKSGKFLTESEIFSGNRVKCETEGMHHCLRGMDASDYHANQPLLVSRHLSLFFEHTLSSALLKKPPLDKNSFPLPTCLQSGIHFRNK